MCVVREFLHIKVSQFSVSLWVYWAKIRRLFVFSVYSLHTERIVITVLMLNCLEPHIRSCTNKVCLTLRVGHCLFGSIEVCVSHLLQ